MSNPDELFDIVDEHDVVVGQAPRSACHGNPELVHRAVHVIIINASGNLLLQKRTEQKDIQPGKWDTSVGGHLELGESYLAAARREMAEEIGLVDIPLTFMYTSTIRNEIESENIVTYLARYSGPVDHNPAEISDVRYWSAAEINAALGCGIFTPNFEEEWRLFQDFNRRYLSGPTEKLGLCAGDSFPDLIQRWDE